MVTVNESESDPVVFPGSPNGIGVYAFCLGHDHSLESAYWNQETHDLNHVEESQKMCQCRPLRSELQS